MSIVKRTICRIKHENSIMVVNKTDSDKITQQPIYSFIRKIKTICNEIFCTKFDKANYYDFCCNHKAFGFMA